MKAKIKGVRIRGICSIVPAHVSYFEDELKNFPFPENSSRRLAKVIGFREHRIADPNTTLTDLAGYGMNYLFQKPNLRPLMYGSLFDPFSRL